MAMEPITIHLTEDAGIARTSEPVQLGVPIPRGALTCTANVRLSNLQTDQPIPCQSAPMAHWPDGSVRWLKLNFLVAQHPYEHLELRLDDAQPEHSPPASPLRHGIEGGQLRISTGQTEFRFSPGELAWHSRTGNAAEQAHELRLTTSAGTPCLAALEPQWTVTDQGPVSLTVAASGTWLGPDQSPLARFHCRLQFFASCPSVKVETCIHNPRRAQHPGGLWDLGDPGSIHFQSLTVHVRNPDSERAWLQASPSQPPATASANKGLYLYQDSSGGEQWQSRNHVNAAGKITTRFRGYQLRSGGDVLNTGDRASPTACLEAPEAAVQASIQSFWQNFPSAIGTSSGELILGLFPADASEPYELQGGERKTQTAWLHYGKEPGALTWTHTPLVPTLDAKHYEKAEAFHWFRANAPEDALDQLIREGLEGPSNFFAKREMIDEYGWRNFGDIFADHETLYQKDDEPTFISHYNNQYDAIYGFARQFALSGDRRWFELLDDLARHVSDVDIYHTEEDRSEYNNGLFWHTDHYLDAHTCAHRTFSRHNSTSSTPGQTGGGPAAEHCYTSGLLYHYFLTGCEDSRQSVFDLANWMVVTHEGQGGFLEQMLALKKHELPTLKALVRGNRPSRHRYPFTRGTGNYLNALLDAWLLDEEGPWLSRAERVIKDTIHPGDDIDQRNLLNVETGWSYLVLLTSLGRYLQIKSGHGQHDASWHYARKAFLRYTNWMTTNEHLFLAVPDRLEFPNATWAAQDIRKAMLMFQAAVFDPDSASSYEQKGQTWLEATLASLQQSEERHFARVQVILLQNYGPHHAGQLLKTLDNRLLSLSSDYTYPRLTWGTLAIRLLHRLIRGLATFRPARERAWLNARLDRR